MASTVPEDTWRNRLAVRLCNLILRTVASSSYRLTLTATLRRGLEIPPQESLAFLHRVIEAPETPPWLKSQATQLLASMVNKPTYITKTGKVLSDADIEALADEAERGYDVSHLNQQQREEQ